MSLERLRAMEILETIKGKRILVLGDVIVDRYESGSVKRISPEAPVPVLENVRSYNVPGGAANVAMNVNSLGGEAHLVGVVGKDDESRILRETLDFNSVDYNLITESRRQTTTKTRFMHRSQQFLRLDRETVAPLEPGTVDYAIEIAGEVLPQCDCVLFSDYAKGFFSRVLSEKLKALCSSVRKPIVVDPKPANGYLIESCHLFMPNRNEGLQIAGLASTSDENSGEIASLLSSKFNTNVVLTDGKNGMFLAELGESVIHVASKVTEVYDVCGAGDTAVAAVALVVGAGLCLLDAAAFANEAARVAVTKLGTAVVLPDDIAASAGASSKLLEWAPLKTEIEKLKQTGKKVVFTNGCFDLLHVGHVKYLQAARTLGDTLVVALNNDDSVKRLKGSYRPLISERQRAELIAALECVDYVTFFEQDTPIEILSLLKPDVFVKGGDYSLETLPEAPIVEKYGGTVQLLPVYGDGISTTHIIDKITGSGESQ